MKINSTYQFARTTTVLHQGIPYVFAEAIETTEALEAARATKLELADAAEEVRGKCIEMDAKLAKCNSDLAALNSTDPKPTAKITSLTAVKTSLTSQKATLDANWVKAYQVDAAAATLLLL